MADTDLLFLALFIFLPIFLLMFLKLIVRPRPVKIPIKSRHVFVTGGSRGIGLALACQVATEGARVTILARNLDQLEEAKTSIRLSTGIDVAIVSVDVCDFVAVKEAVESAGPIDVLICNQGVYASCELENQDIKEIKGTIDVNLIGSFNLVKAALPGMKNRSDRKPVSIAFMSSQAGQVGIYGYAAYSAKIKRRPPLTRIIATSSGAMQVEEVVKKALNGIKSGSFFVPCNFEGFMLSIGTAGPAPQTSYLMAFIEVISVGVIRIVGLCFQWTWYGSIEKWHAQQKLLD
ncbi:hypothetical protein L1987_61214 [Smallanthus sonchifolius]|uniref:Uncharacterized protein n=1 Tax=Smallanthus sonchifolius TaxID=185202 RepID=A0ACB9DA77_9ASTR|nr:hypothetical protein L1987_61214 [Smallanthus sonchifolius]